MATPTTTEQLDTMYTTTWYLRLLKIIDNIFEATPFWYLLKKKGKVVSQTGGRNIEVPLQYAKNESVQYIGKGGTVTLQGTDPLTVCNWEWRNLTGHIIRYYSDAQKNRGKAQLLSKVNADIDNLQSSLIDALEASLFSDGTADSGNEIDGLDNIVDITPATGTVAGLNAANYTWWRNQMKSMSGEKASVYLRKRMNTMFNDCGQYGEGVSRFPDIVVTAQDAYELYDDEALEISRIMIGDKKIADLGFGDLAFKGRPLTWSPSCTAGYMYFLNTAVMQFVYDPIEYFNLGEWLPIVNQPRDRVAHAMTTGNLTTGNRAKLGVIHTIAE